MKVIEEIKYNLYFAVASEVGKLMRESLNQADIDFESLIPVPLHWYKKNVRGFNQAELLAKNMGGKVDDCLRRKRRTVTQVGMNKQERIENLKDVFEMRKAINYRSVALVDDVMTTGTTLEECASVLKKVGVEKVYGIVFARG